MKTYINPITKTLILTSRLMDSVSMSTGGVLQGATSEVIPGEQNYGAR